MLNASTFELNGAQTAIFESLRMQGLVDDAETVLGQWNRIWMEEQRDLGARFIDIGIDPARTTPSWYSNELNWARELNSDLQRYPGLYNSPSIRTPLLPAGSGN